jgi:hypothetical protein
MLEFDYPKKDTICFLNKYDGVNCLKILTLT